jgi:thymidylate kinase
MKNKNNYIIEWRNLHAQIFSSLINKLNKEEVKYFILRNFEGLPNNNTSKDIDIIIEPGSYKKSAEILLAVLKSFEIDSYRVVKYEKVRCWYAMDVEKHFSIHIDLIEGYLSKGFEIFSFKELYQNTIVYNDFKVLNNTYDAVLLLYYKVIGTGQLKKSYREKITNIYKNEKVFIDPLLKRTLNKSWGNKVISLLECKDFDEIIVNATIISKVSKRTSFRNKPFTTTINVFKFLTEKVYRIIICPPKFRNFVSVLGADGTGKTTFIDLLVKAIAYYNVDEETKSKVYHHRPTIMPNLGAVGEKAGVMEQDKDFTNPHRNKPASFFSSFARMVYYWLDYVVGVPYIIRKSAQFDKFTIFDRYIYDFLVDPHRSRINLPYWLRKCFTKAAIQPKIVFVLLTEAEIIYGRKQELTLPEIKRQLVEFYKLAQTNKRFVILDASKMPDEIVTDAMKIIVHTLASKNNLNEK